MIEGHLNFFISWQCREPRRLGTNVLQTTPRWTRRVDHVRNTGHLQAWQLNATASRSLQVANDTKIYTIASRQSLPTPFSHEPARGDTLCQDAKLRYLKAETLRSIPSLSAHLSNCPTTEESITVNLLSHGACLGRLSGGQFVRVSRAYSHEFLGHSGAAGLAPA